MCRYWKKLHTCGHQSDRPYIEMCRPGCLSNTVCADIGHDDTTRSSHFPCYPCIRGEAREELEALGRSQQEAVAKAHQARDHAIREKQAAEQRAKEERIRREAREKAAREREDEARKKVMREREVRGLRRAVVRRRRVGRARLWRCRSLLRRRRY
jgi:hypothetical protein